MNAAVLPLVVSLLAGAAFDGLHIGLLWVAVRRLPEARGGVTAFLLLALARAALLLGALAAAAMLGASAISLVAALVGFLALRLAATWLQSRRVAGVTAWK